MRYLRLWIKTRWLEFILRRLDRRIADMDRREIQRRSQIF